MGALLRAARHRDVPGYSAVIFRRTYVQASSEGGLWDSSYKVYPAMGAEPKDSRLEWRFPKGPTIRMAHLQHEKNRLDWQGAQIANIVFDELTHFTPEQFWYLLSRNRSVCGVKPEINATTNPEPGWVADLLEWWIDPESGYPIPSRSGVKRWFVRVNDGLVWGDIREQLEEDYPELEAMSLTFIAGKLEDNPLMTEADPRYRSKLLALGTVERERLLEGNWKIRITVGAIFQNFNEANLCDSTDVPRDMGKYAFDEVRIGLDPGDVNPYLVVVGRRGSTWYVMEAVEFGNGTDAVLDSTVLKKAADLCKEYGVDQCRIPPERPTLISAWRKYGEEHDIHGLKETIKAFNRVEEGNSQINDLFAALNLMVLRAHISFRQHLNDYVRKKDAQGNFLDKPAEGQFDHPCDALRYAIAEKGYSSEESTQSQFVGR